MTSYKAFRIHYDLSIDEFSASEIGISPMWCGVNMAQLTRQLQEYYREETDVAWETIRSEGKFAFEHGLYITPSPNTGLDPFLVYATKVYIPEKNSAGIYFYF